MHLQASPIDMIHSRRSGVRDLELPRLLNEPDLPRLRVIMPIGKLAGFGQIGGGRLSEQGLWYQPLAGGHIVRDACTGAAYKRRAQQQHCYCPQARNGSHW